MVQLSGYTTQLIFFVVEVLVSLIVNSTILTQLHAHDSVPLGSKPETAT